MDTDEQCEPHGHSNRHKKGTNLTLIARITTDVLARATEPVIE